MYRCGWFPTLKQRDLGKLRIPDRLKEFDDVLIKLRNLDILCNRGFLPSNFPKVIDKFSSAWRSLTSSFLITKTLKIHILCTHLADYFHETGLTLLKTTDQLIENMHQYLHKRLIKSLYYVKDIENVTYGNLLYRAILYVSSYNLPISD